MDNNTAKTALGVGVGIVIGKWGGTLAWWCLGGAAAVFIANSAGAQSAISSGISKFRK